MVANAQIHGGFLVPVLDSDDSLLTTNVEVINGSIFIVRVNQ
jgi:hypothetical protein